MNDISSGKLRGIMKLADTNGRFKMMAIDQRGSMVQALADALDKDKGDVHYDDVAALKTLITPCPLPERHRGSHRSNLRTPLLYHRDTAGCRIAAGL